MRHRFTIWDMCVLLAAAALLLFLSGEYDLLRVVGLSQGRAQEVELGEVFLIAAILGVFLFVALRRMRAQQREVTRRRAAEAKARELAFQDSLTGLPNRRQFDKAVAEAIAAPPGAGHAHAVLMLDLNGFKAVNDLYGHPTGDVVLIAVAARLATVVRGTGDQISRLGGDEFGIIASHLRGPEDASSIALRLIAAMRDPIQAGDTLHHIGTGIGIALFPRDGSTAEEIIRRADVALYRAKAEPGSSLHFFEEEMDAQLRERAMLEGELRRAVAAGDVVPHYQPIMDLTNGEVVGFELLPYWRHDLFGDVPRERFIPLAEETGLIRGLSDTLLRAACRDASRWPGHTILSFNVSIGTAKGTGLRPSRPGDPRRSRPSSGPIGDRDQRSSPGARPEERRGGARSAPRRRREDRA